MLVILLAGAAYRAGNLLNRPTSSQNNPAGGQVLPKGGGSVQANQQNNKDQITPASELPTIQPDVRGVFLSRSNDTFVIGTGNVGISLQGNGSGEVTPNASYDGPTYQVVVTKNTVIYKDTTPLNPGETGKIQQTVAPGSLDDFNSITLISVWGNKTGDRYVADVILYTVPQTKLNGGGGGTLK